MRLETKRLTLRPLKETDFEDFKAIWGDAETMTFYPAPYSDERIKEIIAKYITTFEEHGYGLLAVVEKSSGGLVGDCGITIQMIDGAEAYEIGYHIHKAHWGKGYATEAARAVKHYGFETLKLTKLYSYMDATHRQSRRVAEKNGMTLEKEYLNPRNRNLPTVVYSTMDCADRDSV